MIENEYGNNTYNIKIANDPSQKEYLAVHDWPSLDKRDEYSSYVHHWSKDA